MMSTPPLGLCIIPLIESLELKDIVAGPKRAIALVASIAGGVVRKQETRWRRN